MKIMLVINLYSDNIKLEIKQNNRVLDFVSTKYYHDLSDVLITGLDSLLKRNNIDATAIKSFKIKENIGKDSTSYKIASAFVEGLKI